MGLLNQLRKHIEGEKQEEVRGESTERHVPNPGDETVGKVSLIFKSIKENKIIVYVFFFKGTGVEFTKMVKTLPLVQGFIKNSRQVLNYLLILTRDKTYANSL